jgi:hypothetical protein
MTIYGWDASDFDWGRGPMDLAAARADGIDFFTHKATESTNTQHIHYGEVMNRARAAGVPFLGAYHVVRTGDIMAQISYFLAYVTAQTPWWSSFPGWFFQGDLEKWSYDPVAASMGPAFCAEVERRTSKRCVLYAPKWAYGDTIGGSAPLWASAYGSNPAGPYRNAYPGDASPSWGAYSGRTPAILQFGSQATIGRQPICDINAFRGTVADFAQLIGGEAVLGGGTPLTPEDDLTPDELQLGLRTFFASKEGHDRIMIAVNDAITTDAIKTQLTAQANLGVRQVLASQEGHDRIMVATGDAIDRRPALDPAALAAAVVKALPASGGALTPADVEKAVTDALNATTLHVGA